MELKNRKQLKEASEKFKAAISNGWVTQEEVNTVLKSFEDNELYIAVIGQMNSGKSTLINALIFEEEILPTSATPETTVLTEIKYGEQDKIVVHFITKNTFSEIELLKNQQSQNSENQELSHSYAILYDKIVSIENYGNLFGTVKQIDFSSYKDYIGKNGKWVGIVDRLEIFINNEKIKGCVIMDTPGFNDPYSVRNQNTFAALSKANVIIYMSQSDCFLDQTDLMKLSEQVSERGIGKMLVCLNHMEEIDASEWDGEVLEMEKRRDMKAREIRALAEESASKDQNDLKATSLNHTAEMISKAKIIPYSGIMAMLGFYQRNRSIKISDETKNFYSIFNEMFEFNDDPEKYLEQSHLSIVEYEINNIISNDKDLILEEAPLKKLIALLNEKILHKIRMIKELEKQNEELQDKNKDWQREEENFELFRQTLAKTIKDTKHNISVQTKKAIDETEKKWQDARDEWAEEKIMSPYFGETYFLSSGILKGNFNAYQNLVDDFVSSVIRNGQNTLKSTCVHIKNDNMSLMRNSLNKECMDIGITSVYLNSLIDDLYNSVDGIEPVVKIKIISSISYVPSTGSKMQVVYYKDRFKYTDFSDEILCNDDLRADGTESYMSKFINYRDNVNDKLSNAGVNVSSKYLEFINKVKDSNNILSIIEDNIMLISEYQNSIDKMKDFISEL